jgi:hypothetical protein
MYFPPTGTIASYLRKSTRFSINPPEISGH